MELEAQGVNGEVHFTASLYERIEKGSDAGMTNAEIADRLMSLAQLLAAQKENPFKVKAYRRAAKTIRTLGESMEEMVRAGADLTEYSGIGKAIGSAITEMVSSGTLGQLEELRAQVSPEVAAISEYPRLDPARVLRIYKKLNISSVAALEEKLASGEIAAVLGARMDQHVRAALFERHEMKRYDADGLVSEIESFLLTKCRVARVDATGDYRRKVEVVGDLSFLIDTEDFPAVVARMTRYGGKAEVLSSDDSSALLRLASGVLLKIELADGRKWGVALIAVTGSDEHVRKLDGLGELAAAKQAYRDEAAVYRKLGLSFIEPELREGRDEVELAARGALPELISEHDICGELHAHSTSSDGANTIEQMAAAARARGYEYTGITDHSPSLKIAGGVSESDLWKQIRYIDKLNEKGNGIRILKSAEVDILADGALDYSDDLLKELDYTVCSIHSRFALGKAEQTERILRAMDNRYFTILGHATGRKLLSRPGYEIDIARLIGHAKRNGCFFEINSSPDRLDLSAVNARLAREAGVLIAINTDAHSVREYGLVRYGIEQARRAGLTKKDVLNARSWRELRRLVRR